MRNNIPIIVTFLLALCLLVSLAANAGLVGWALWLYGENQQKQELAAALASDLEQVQQQLQQAQERIAALEAEVEFLRQAVEESGAEIPLDPADEELMDTIEVQVVELRGLQLDHPVERAVMTRGQLGARVQEEFGEDFSPGEARDYALTLAAFDMLDPGIDMHDLLLRLYTEQIAGFYDPETEEIYVIADAGPMGEMERITYAHEFVHALQDQHYDLEALGLRDGAEDEYDSEYLIAVQSLIEGDASFLQRQFLQAHYTVSEMMALMGEIGEVDMAVLEGAPDVLAESLQFPYLQGLTFVQELYMEGGWPAVNRAYADPPRSSEHILHLERYHAGDMPQLVSLAPLTDTLGAGWRQVDEDTFGEFFTRYYLDQQLSLREAEIAAEGWGGDRYAVHTRESDGALVMVLRTAWDTPADAEEFVDAYAAYGEGRFGHAADETDGARMCWAGEADHLCLSWAPADTTVVLGPDGATVEAVLALVEAEE